MIYKGINAEFSPTAKPKINLDTQSVKILLNNPSATPIIPIKSFNIRAFFLLSTYNTKPVPNAPKPAPNGNRQLINAFIYSTFSVMPKTTAIVSKETPI